MPGFPRALRAAVNDGPALMRRHTVPWALSLRFSLLKLQARGPARWPGAVRGADALSLQGTPTAVTRLSRVLSRVAVGVWVRVKVLHCQGAHLEVFWKLQTHHVSSV